MPIRILLVAGSYPPDRCGVGDYTRQLATALTDLPGTEVSVLTTGADAQPADERGVAVRRVLPDWSLRSARPMLRVLRLIRPDIVHVQYPTQGYGMGGLPWLVPALARACGAGVVQTWHEGFTRRDLPRFFAMALTPGRTLVVRKAWPSQFRWPFGTIARWRRPVYVNSASTLPPSRLSPPEVAALRLRYGVEGRRLIVFFGFIHPLKRIEMVFDIADPATDHVLIVGNVGDQADYAARIERLAQEKRWRGHARVVGFVDHREAANILKAADALVLPLRIGGGEWNTAILAGIGQGTFVLTTSTSASGYDPDANTYYAPIDGLAEMRQALRVHAGQKRAPASSQGDAFDWASIAYRHLELYRTMVTPGSAPHPPSGKNPA